MNPNKTKIKQQWIYLPFLFCSSAAIAAGQSAPSPHFEDDFREVNNANFDYVGGNTRIGVGVDTEFDGTADISHIFSETKDTATSGDAWIGFDFSGEDKGVNAGGARLNHHWVSRDAQGRPLRVNKIFGAYDRNADNDDRATVGYGQEIDKGFWEAHVGKGLSGKRKVSRLTDGRTVSEKGYKYNVGGQVGTFLPGSNIRVRGGLDYAWDNERGVGESKPEQYTISGGVEKFFQGTPHSVSLDVAASRNDGGHGKSNTDSRANLSYHYDFGGADIYQNDQEIRRVRVEMPGHAHPAKVVRKAVKTPYKQAYKKAVRVRSCQLVKSTVELGSDTFFKPNSSRLIPSAKKRLNKVLAQIHRTGYKGNIRITGNTCDIGSLKHNQALSERRASAVKQYFTSHGFDNAEVIARGLGETRPKYPNTGGNRHKNRRVDIEYVSEDKSCRPGYKTVYKTAYKTAYKTTFKNIRVQDAGMSKPSVTWKTEVVQAEPTWVKRALHNSVRHNRYISTYQTTAGSNISNGTHTTPVLTNDVVTTAVNTPVTINALENDTGNGLTITHVTQPSHGSSSIVNGSIVFTPETGFTGTDSFTYTVTDSNGAQAQATVNINIAANSQNVAPIAHDVTAHTTTIVTTGSSVTINALENDVDADGDTLSIIKITQPDNGTSSIVNNQILYTPDQNFTGTDTFSYTISDGHGHTTTATISVVVANGGSSTNSNTAPVAQDDVAETDGHSVIVNVLSNDSDPNNDKLNIISVTQAQNGSVSIEHNNLVFTPNQGFVGADSFTYTISDGHGHETTATVNAVVTGGNTGSNNTPVANADLVTNSIGQAVTINVLSNDTDADNDTLTIINVSQSQNGTATIRNNQIVYVPNNGFVGSDSVTYTISDGHGHTASATVNITVSSTSSNSGNSTEGSINVPPVAEPDHTTLTHGSFILDVLKNDDDYDGDRLTIIKVDKPSNGRASIVNQKILYTPRYGFSGLDSFSYTISDGQGHTAKSTVSINVDLASQQVLR